MLGICGNGEVIKSLIILEKSFPLVRKGESNHFPQEILLWKTDKGSMEKDVFCLWLENSVIPHKQLVNPNDFPQLILDNHGSWFNADAIEICTENKIEVLCYPGHLTHILQGPDVVLNKPISAIEDKTIHIKPIIGGNSDISRTAFMTIIDYVVKTKYTKENVYLTIETKLI